ncbi:hypothetical protein EI541_19885 [Xanthomonas citri pv. eucalyptorum]|nr:hypothetical protein EI541_19885 [Xanthomonas axonopodis pv. eucalyptorum]
MQEDGFDVSMVKLCRWFGVPRRSVYYTPRKTAPKVKPELAGPIKAMIEAEPSFGYRTVAGLLRMNKNTVQRIFQIRGWQVCKRAVGKRPRIEALPSVASAPNQRWATDLCRVWGGKDGWLSLALVIDCHTRQLLGWQLSRTGRASTAVAALEQALITRFGTLGNVVFTHDSTFTHQVQARCLVFQLLPITRHSFASPKSFSLGESRFTLFVGS